MIATYYIICVIYCFYQLSNRYRKDMMPGGLGVTPSMDAIAVLLLGWILAPIDFFLTWVRIYKEASERRKNNRELLKEEDETF
jgi:hypothetical protein